MIKDSIEPAIYWRVPASVPLHAASAMAQELGLHGLQLRVWSPGCDLLDGPSFSIEALRGALESQGLAVSLDCTGTGLTVCTTSLELSRGALTYLARVFNLAERLAAKSVVVPLGARFGHGSGIELAESTSRWVDGGWKKAVRDNLLRLAGLGAGRGEVMVAADDITRPVSELLSPIVSAGYLGLCLDFDLMYGPAVDEALSGWVEEHLQHVHVVRVHNLSQFLQMDETNVRRIAELVRLNVHEWTIVLREGEELTDASVTLRELLNRAFRQITGEMP